jgi:hypothetical protein
MQTYAAPEHIPVPQFTDFRKEIDGRSQYDFEAHFAAENEYVTKVQEWAKQQEPHKLSGALIRRPRGDGYALYVVVKVAGKVSMVWLNVGDAWDDPSFERTATVKELTTLVEHDRAFNEFWAKQSTPQTA